MDKKLAEIYMKVSIGVSIFSGALAFTALFITQIPNFLIIPIGLVGLGAFVASDYFHKKKNNIPIKISDYS